MPLLPHVVQHALEFLQNLRVIVHEKNPLHTSTYSARPALSIK